MNEIRGQIMIKKETTIFTEQLELFELDLQAQFEEFEYEVEVGEGFDRAIIVAGAEEGEIEISVDGIEGNQVSEYLKAKVFLGKIITGTKRLVVRISARGARNLQISIAMIKESFKNSIDQLPCRACKTFAKLAVSSVLAHLGVPYFDATKTVDMPGVELPSPIPGGSAIPSDETIPVLIGKPIELHEQTKQWFENAVENSEGQLAEYFNEIDPSILSTIRIVFESINWLYDGVDKIYTKVCELLRCCRPVVA